MSYDLVLINGDLKISNTSDIQVVRDNEKLRQDVLKILMTPIGGNKANPWYGSNVNNVIVGGVFDVDFTRDVAREQVRSALENLQILQNSQARTQTLTAGEKILSVKNVYINNNPTDQRVIELKVEIITGALTVMTTKFYIRL